MPGAQLMGWDATNEVWVRCVVTADGKLIINPTGFLENPPTEDQDKKAPTSEWVYDHAADISAHHAKYTDVESRAAIGDLLSSAGALFKDLLCSYKTIKNLLRIHFKQKSSDNTYIYMQKLVNTATLRLLGTQSGVGSVATQFLVYDGTAYRKLADINEVDLQIVAKLENPPTEDVTDKAPSSEWAFDHSADASAHHTKYTNAEAVGSFYARKKVLDTGTYTNETVSNISYVDLDPTSDTIHIKGLADGIEGQIIFFVVRSSSYQTIIYYNSGDAAAGDKILTTTKANVTVPDYASFFMIYDGLYWICNFIT